MSIRLLLNQQDSSYDHEKVERCPQAARQAVDPEAPCQVVKLVKLPSLNQGVEASWRY